MDEQINTVPSPEILPQATNTANYGAVQETAVRTMPSAKKGIPPLFIIAGVVAVIVIGSLLFASGKNQTTSADITPTPLAPTPTNVSAQNVTPIATQSAFMQFETTINNLPGIIQGAALQDPSILPPVLDLPLGFSN